MYVIILKGKRGDRWALRNLSSHARAETVPLLEPAGNTDECVKVVEAMEGWTSPIWLDQSATQSTTRTQFERALTAANSLGLQVLPVLRLGSPTQVVQAAASHLSHGLSLRLDADSFEDLNQLGNGIDALRSALNLKRNRIDVVVDYGAQDRVGPIVGMARLHVGQLPHVGAFRSLTVIAGAFPDSISTLPSGPNAPWQTVSRAEWLAYDQIRAHPNHIARVPEYGDYGPRGPGYPTATFAGSPNLRYTLDGEWLVRRGRHKRNPDMHQICQELVNRTEFMGSSWSAGDLEIERCANRQIGPGGGEQWTRWGVNHHVETVVDAL